MVIQLSVNDHDIYHSQTVKRALLGEAGSEFPRNYGTPRTMNHMNFGEDLYMSYFKLW